MSWGAAGFFHAVHIFSLFTVLDFVGDFVLLAGEHSSVDFVRQNEQVTVVFARHVTPLGRLRWVTEERPHPVDRKPLGKRVALMPRPTRRAQFPHLGQTPNW